jgi:hypothetical protein
MNLSGEIIVKGKPPIMGILVLLWLSSAKADTLSPDEESNICRVQTSAPAVAPLFTDNMASRVASGDHAGFQKKIEPSSASTSRLLKNSIHNCD